MSDSGSDTGKTQVKVAWIAALSAISVAIITGVFALAPSLIRPATPIPPATAEAAIITTPPDGPSATIEPTQKPIALGENRLEIDVNGQHRTYVASDFNFSLDKWVSLLSADQYNPHQDNFLLELPAEVKQGAVIVDGQSPTNQDSNPVSQALDLMNNINSGSRVAYTDRSGQLHSRVNSAPGTYFKITIDQWGGRGRVATGRLEGVVQINAVDQIKFTNGRFAVKIQDAAY